ncbi:MCE family protein [Mycobacterium sp. OAE908]|uniref:MCE family protein n=1 Tax=Mycobacterium sp. OAE908 TaxID=2817899 RepID=UPI001AE29E85
MDTSRDRRRLHPAWWTLILTVALTGFVVVCSGFFFGEFSRADSVTLTSERAGLVMETGAKVKMRGIDIGQVGAISGGDGPVRLTLEISPDQMKYIPANVVAEINATTAFGAKYVDLISPADPSPQPLAAGAVLHSRNVSTEVNTVFENLVGVLKQIDVAKLNATLSALADGVRGQGQRIGEATTSANQLLLAINPRMDQIAADWRSLKGFSDAYGGAAPNILASLKSASVTATTITRHATDLDALLLNTIGFSDAGINLLAPNRDNLINAVNAAAPTTSLLMKYNPEYTCLLLGAKDFIDNGGHDTLGGNGRTLVTDSTFLLGDDPYQYPDNLPVIAAKGGPGGKPGCGSLPDASKNFPVRQLVTNTGWGTGTDIRTNPGIGHPCWADFLPATRAVPQQASIRQCLPGPAIGPMPYPGAPPQGAKLYAPDGTPLYPGVPPPPPPPPGPPAP